MKSNKLIDKAVLFIFGCGMLLTCSNTHKNEQTREVSFGERPAEDYRVNEVTVPSDSGIVHMTLIDGKGNIQIRKKEDQTIYIEFVSNGYKRLTGRLSSSDSLANIRFSQITIPDGTMDGPFSTDIEYRLSMDGTYRLLVHENTMAGDPWGGIFNVEILLTK